MEARHLFLLWSICCPLSLCLKIPSFPVAAMRKSGRFYGVFRLSPFVDLYIQSRSSPFLHQNKPCFDQLLCLIPDNDLEQKEISASPRRGGKREEIQTTPLVQEAGGCHRAWGNLVCVLCERCPSSILRFSFEGRLLRAVSLIIYLHLRLSLLGARLSVLWSSLLRGRKALFDH